MICRRLILVQATAIKNKKLQGMINFNIRHSGIDFSLWAENRIREEATEHENKNHFTRVVILIFIK